MLMSEGAHSSKSQAEETSKRTSKLQIRKKDRLQEATRLIKISYYKMFISISRRLMITPLEELLDVLPEHLCLKCTKLRSTEDIFFYDSPLNEEWNWFDLSLLTSIVEKLGDEVCKRRLREYKDKLHHYLLNRLLRDNNGEVGETMNVVIDNEWNFEDVKRNSGAEYIALILKTSKDKIIFVSEKTVLSNN